MRAWWIVTLAVLALPARALAGNDDGILVGSEASLVSGAVVATGNDAASAFYNPAAMAGVEYDSVDVTGTAFTLRFYRADDVLSYETGEATSDSYSSLGSAPSAVGFARRLSDRLALGFGLYLPQRDELVIGPRLDIGEGADAKSFLVSIDLGTSRYFGGVTIGFRASDTLRLGATLYGTYTSGHVRVDFVGAGGPADMAAYVTGGSVLADSDRIGLTGAVGVQWDATPELTFGASVLAPTLELAQSGSYAVQSLEGSASGQLEFAIEDGMQVDTGLAVSAPLRVRLGAALRIGTARFSLDGDVQTALDESDVQRRALVNGRFGVRVPVSSSLAIGGGLFTDRSPSASAAGFANEQVDFYGGTLGVTWSTSYTVHEEEEDADAPSSIRFSTTAALRYAYGTGTIGGLRFTGSGPEGNAVDMPSDVTAHELSLNLGSSLTF